MPALPMIPNMAVVSSSGIFKPAATVETYFIDSPRPAMLVLLAEDALASTSTTRPIWSACNPKPRSVDAAMSAPCARSIPSAAAMLSNPGMAARISLVWNPARASISWLFAACMAVNCVSRPKSRACFCRSSKFSPSAPDTAPTRAIACSKSAATLMGAPNASPKVAEDISSPFMLSQDRRFLEASNAPLDL